MNTAPDTSKATPSAHKADPSQSSTPATPVTSTAAVAPAKAVRKASTQAAAPGKAVRKAPTKATTAASPAKAVRKTSTTKAATPAKPNSAVTAPESTPVKPKTAAPKAAASPAKPLKDKKVKVVRDSFTIPKTELLQIGESKKRALMLGIGIKKSELIRAGLQALTSMNDAAFKKALASVPTIKTGRPAKS